MQKKNPLENKILKQYSLVIYPVDFVVAFGDLEKEINAKYKPYDEDYNYIGKPKSPTTASTYRVREKKTSNACVMVWFPYAEDWGSSVITHEVGHAALDVFDYIGEEVSLQHQEPFCYLLGTLTKMAVNTLYEMPFVYPPTIGKPAKKKKE